MRANKTITVYEHDRLKVGMVFDTGNRKVEFKQSHLQALEKHYGNGGLNYYQLINKGIKFNQFVGVLQVGELTIEVLPKVDKTHDENRWRTLLIGMLKTVGTFNIQAPSSAALNTKNNFILDLYFALFLKEVAYLVNLGLVKKYTKTEGQSLALKGALQFGQHISKNLVHQERFFVRYSKYSYQQPLNQILFKTLKLLKRINSNAALHSRIGSLLLHFPELPDITVREADFEKIIYNRKTTVYKDAIEISRLLLLNYHPDVSAGKNHILAIMFDMNALWERFVYISLRKNRAQYQNITAQAHKYFWRPKKGNRSSIRPDIVIKNKVSSVGEKPKAIVFDTKWKNIQSSNPSSHDLRQMYVYHDYFNAEKVALVYPGEINQQISGQYLNKINGQESNKTCGIITIGIHENVKVWQDEIYKQLNGWIVNA
ncbi:McrC family protein [Marinicella gelatinilytica]|uniref:McrC family protein n=1 Tax=Marinicella gelatinilytica TaxID=2996017 RepID=UPI002260A3DE|nr:hypothetical protein [Marinicella gelatinilytica]MCX7545504.1 hypothetical protein [Marinicella gelatinilytica]